MKKNLLLIIGSFFLALINLQAQDNTVGLISYDPGKSFDGYNLIFPHNQPNVFLLNNCGELVHVWEDSSDFRPGNTAYLRPNGNLVKAKRRADISNDPIWAGGGGAIVEIRSWDNDLLWSFERNNENHRLHHDIEVTPEGTILMIVWERKTMEEAIQAGRDTALIPDEEVWSEMILEVDPGTDEIVWEWHLWDHLVQDYDASKDNFGVVADHPELLDINFTSNNGGRDWIHANSIDLILNGIQNQNQIILSTPFLRELWVLDRTTTTAQAAGHFGGDVGKGGDLIYRWGNPQVYDAGTPDDQLLFNNHDVTWVSDFLEPTHPYYGKFSMFNNQAGPDFSTFNIISPPWEMYETQYIFENGIYGPENFDVDLTHPTPTNVYSTGLSSVQVLPNSNLLICSGRQGYAFEMTPDNEIVWEYITPIIAGQPASQGDTLQLNNNLTFRMDRYPRDYAAFNGNTLDPIGWIELNPDSTLCDEISPTILEFDNYQLSIFPNPASQLITIEWEGGVYVDIEVVDLMGRMVIEPMRLTGGRKYLDVSHLNTGIYFVRINQKETKKLLIVDR